MRHTTFALTALMLGAAILPRLPAEAPPAPGKPNILWIHAQGKLNPLQEEILFSPTRPAEELYDVRADPHETRNLAGDPKFRATLETLRGRLDGWMVETLDGGPESEDVYDANVADELKHPANKGSSTPFPRPPVRPERCFNCCPPKANS